MHTPRAFPRSRLLTVCGLACLLGLPACSKASARAGEAAPSVPAPSSTAGSESAGQNARALGLAKSGGTTPVDVELEKLQKTVQQFPVIRDYWIALGRLWVRKAREAADPGFYLNAKACADVSLDLEPGNRPGENLLGLVFLNDHRFYDALDLADKLLAEDRDDLMALGTRSDALLELGRFDEAVHATQRMVNVKPNLPSYSRAGYLRWLTGDTQGARDIMWKAIDSGRDPRDPEPLAWVLVQAAMMFFHEGDYKGANAGFDRALDVAKDYPAALVGKGRYLLLAEDDPRHAAELLDRAYKLSPLVETAWLLGDARQAAGDAKGAEAAYAIVVKDGRRTDGRTLAQFYACKNRDIAEATKLIEAELKTRGGVYTDDAHAWVLYRAGKLAEARAASDKALRLGTKDATLFYHAGAIRLAMGDKDGGEKLVREALRLSPRFDLTGAAEARRLVNRDAGGG